MDKHSKEIIWAFLILGLLALWIAAYIPENPDNDSVPVHINTTRARPTNPSQIAFDRDQFISKGIPKVKK